MRDADKLFAGSIPEIYDRFLVPLIFEPYACDWPSGSATGTPHDILEIAAGTGVLTRATAARLSVSTRIVATDLNQAMLDQAARQTASGSRPWRQADALALPFADHAFDAVACQFGVMFFPEKIKGYREAHRVLKPGGRFFFNVWDRIAETTLPAAVTDALATLFSAGSAFVYGAHPAWLSRYRENSHDLSAAGFADIAIETVDHRSKAASPREAAIAYCQGTPLRNEIEARDASRLGEATQLAADAIARPIWSGPVDGRIRAHVVTATG